MKAWGPAAIWAAVLFLLSESEPGTGALWTLGHDKVGHLGLYGVLGALLAWGGHKSQVGYHISFLVLAGVLYGVLDEWHQSFVPGRTPSGGDILADAVGVILGVLAFRFLLVHEPWKRGKHFT